MTSRDLKKRREEQRIEERIVKVINGKIFEATRYAVRFSVYNSKTTFRELSTAQSLLLSLLHGLLRRDIPFCSFIIDISSTAVQLWSSFIKVWLKDDFIFKTDDIAEAFSNLSIMMDHDCQRKIELPQNIAVAFSGLVDKYKLFDVFNLSGNIRALEFVTVLRIYCLEITKEPETTLQNNSRDAELVFEPVSHNVELDTRKSLSSKVEESIELSEESSINNVEVEVEIERVVIKDDETTPSLPQCQEVSGVYNPSTVQCSPPAVASPIIQEVDEASGYSSPAPTPSSSQHEVGHEFLRSYSERVPALNDEVEIKLFLEDAVRQRDVTTIMILLECGLNVNGETVAGERLLHLGVYSGCTETVGVLLSFGAIPQLKNQDLNTPLQLAVQLNILPIIELLLMNGGDIDEPFSDGNSLLHKAVSAKSFKTVLTLLRFKPGLDLKNNDGYTALHLATKAGCLKIMQALINGGANLDILSNEVETCLHLSVISGNIDAIHALMRSKASAYIKHKSGINAFHLTHNINILNSFVSHGIYVDTRTDDGSTLLHLVSYNGNIELAKRLIESGCTINATNEEKDTPLFKAIEGGHTEIVSLLINAGARVNYVNPLTKDAPIHLAAELGQFEVTRLLLDLGVDVNTPGDKRWAPIHNAAKGGYSSIVSLLIERGADVNLRNEDNDTGLHWAAYHGYREIVDILLDNGADINAIGDYGNTPLKVAFCVKRRSVVRLLQERGALL